MKRGWMLIMLLCAATATEAGAQALCDSSWHRNVKSVELYCEGKPLEAPVLTMGQRSRMVLEFDVLGEESPQLRWSIGHCDRNWRCDDLEPNEYMNGFEQGIIDNYDFSFTTLTSYVHYTSSVPGQYSEFIHSGNYILAVTDDSGDTLLTRRFCVSEEVATVKADINRPYDGIDIDRRQEVDVCVASKEVPLIQQYVSIVAQQNGRLDTRRELQFSGYDGNSLCFRHRKSNIFDGGNVFRFFDMSSLGSAMYNVLRVEEYGGEQMVIIRPCEDRSKKHYVAESALNGGWKVNIWDRNNPDIEADYVWVNISLPLAQPRMDGEVFVVGGLTDWQLDSTSRMDYDPRLKAYTKRLLLKQGYYAYQIVMRRMREKSGLTSEFEGDHRETMNNYTVYVYYKSPADRSDRLLAVRRFVAE